MKRIQIVFSPTGGTGKVADIIAEEWSGSCPESDKRLRRLCCKMSEVCTESKRCDGILKPE